MSRSTLALDLSVDNDSISCAKSFDVENRKLFSMSEVEKKVLLLKRST